jgi:predicted LPLAT superfamily acyltransferase
MSRERVQGHWARMPERGTRFGLRFLTACYRLVGERLLGLALYPVVAYFLLTGGVARRASMDYFARLRRFSGGATPAPGWRTSFRHMRAFAVSALHKVGAWAGRLDSIEVRFPDRTRLDELLSRGRGALLLGAHFGNLEMTRAMATQRWGAKVTAIVYSQHAAAFRDALEAASPEFAANLVHVGEIGPDTVLLLRDKIERGELVVIAGDRTPAAENDRVCTVDFLGSPAQFAQGPFLLAHLLECPVHLLFCPREGDGYRIYLEPFAERIELPRASRTEALHDYAQRYAARLETLCVQSPYQWFNFYDYWQIR